MRKKGKNNDKNGRSFTLMGDKKYMKINEFFSNHDNSRFLGNLELFPFIIFKGIFEKWY